MTNSSNKTESMKPVKGNNKANRGGIKTQTNERKDSHGKHGRKMKPWKRGPGKSWPVNDAKLA